MVQGTVSVETNPSVYSHGLEAIYSIQNVDLKTVRRFNADASQPEQNGQQQASYSSEPVQTLSSDIYLDLGIPFEKKIVAFQLQEPIQVLKLAHHLESELLAKGKILLRDLLDVNDPGVQKVLTAYLGEPIAHETALISFASWLRSLIGPRERREILVYLAAADLVQKLSSFDEMEVKRFSDERRRDILQQIDRQVTGNRKQFIRDMEMIKAAFIEPWMAHNGNIITELELLDLLETISDAPEDVRAFSSLFARLWNTKTSPFADVFTYADQGVYCASLHQAAAYESVIEVAQSYFYTQKIRYPLDQLKSLLHKELARLWIGYSDVFIEKVLRTSSYFYIIKDANHQLTVCLA